MKDLETRLREQAQREREQHDPGDLFWARLPGATWQAYQADAEKRRRRWRWWPRLVLPFVTACTAAAALVLVLRSHHPQPTVKKSVPLDPSITMEADMMEMMDEPSDDIASGQPATELLEHWHVPADVIIDELNDKQLAALAEQLGKS